MSDTPENPPAFPIQENDWTTGQRGMSLRDWFAGQAIIGCLNSPTNEKINSQLSGLPISQRAEFGDALAIMAYIYADAMLKARGE